MNSPASDWIETLAAECRRTSQAQTAKRIGRSAAVVNQVLKGTYKGNLGDVEKRVRGALMRETVACPVLGAVATNRCLDEQAQPFSTASRLRVALYRACQTCINKRRPS